MSSHVKSNGRDKLLVTSRRTCCRSHSTKLGWLPTFARRHGVRASFEAFAGAANEALSDPFFFQEDHRGEQSADWRFDFVLTSFSSLEAPTPVLTLYKASNTVSFKSPHTILHCQSTKASASIAKLITCYGLAPSMISMQSLLSK